MGRWEYRLDLKQHLTDADQPTQGQLTVTAAGISESARRWMRRPTIARRIDDYELDVADLEHACDELDDMILSGDLDVDELNRILDDIYSWADWHSVWIGGEKQSVDPSAPGRAVAIAGCDGDVNSTTHPDHW
ncbi:MAG TPA: hypothetical protein VF156_15530 [Agromyces sp.]